MLGPNQNKTSSKLKDDLASNLEFAARAAIHSRQSPLPEEPNLRIHSEQKAQLLCDNQNTQSVGDAS